MNHPVNEWIEKAEEDYHAALTLRRLRRHPTHNAVCFHAQQCVEKYLKAILERQGAVIRKIHTLQVLLEQCAESHPLLIAMRPNMVKLSEYAVEFRYPGESATAADAAEAIRLMKTSRLALCVALNIAPDATPARARKQR
ncbi:MAG: HEPN domain-containing protein [Lentisphaerae bacterium]|nr:HEPN domain-containing protein [Lentisphaerota bacterium]